jgi:hypothetical protein
VRPLIIVVMALGSIAMWVALPVGLVWIASQLTDSTQPSMGPYLLILFGLPIGMTLIGKGLGKLDRIYASAGGEVPQRYRPGWTRSMRGERESGRKWSILDRVMFVSVVLCLIAMAIWFFGGYAGSPLPSA